MDVQHGGSGDPFELDLDILQEPDLSSIPAPKHNRPSITIIMRVYNNAQYLMEAINSLRSQTFMDFEVICIEGGSRDGSRKMLERSSERDGRFVLVEDRGSGESAAFNAGLYEAKGAYVMFMRPEDFLERNALELLARAAKISRCDVIKANSCLYWSEPKPRDIFVPSVTASTSNHALRAIDEPEVFFGCSTSWAGLYKRSFLLGNGLDMLEEGGFPSDHMDFGFKTLATAERVFCIQDVVLHIRQDNIDYTIERHDEAFLICREFDAIEDFVEADDSRKALRPYVYRLRYDVYKNVYARLDHDLGHEFLPIMVGDIARGIQDGDYAPVLFEPEQNEGIRILLDDPESFASKIAKPQGQKKRSGLFGKKKR